MSSEHSRKLRAPIGLAVLLIVGGAVTVFALRAGASRGVALPTESWPDKVPAAKPGPQPDPARVTVANFQALRPNMSVAAVRQVLGPPMFEKKGAEMKNALCQDWEYSVWEDGPRQIIVGFSEGKLMELKAAGPRLEDWPDQARTR